MAMVGLGMLCKAACIFERSFGSDACKLTGGNDDDDDDNDDDDDDVNGDNTAKERCDRFKLLEAAPAAATML
jgi:hypothetical protein